jgi:hypothetical protein
LPRWIIVVRSLYRPHVQPLPHLQLSPQLHPGRRLSWRLWHPHVHDAPEHDLQPQTLEVSVFFMTLSSEMG